MTETANGPIFATVELDEPIKRGETEIATIRLRKPKSGELRGLSMVDIIKLEVDALHKLIPRISEPPITEPEVAEMSPTDLFSMSTEVANFFLPKGVRVDSPAT